jgi:beta-N-acetylhexosaminidase
MLDVAGTELTDDDRRRLAHPLVGGVILFSRNYRDPAQLEALTAEIHALKSAPLLIGVDHEAAAWRFQGFTAAHQRLGESERHPARQGNGARNRLRAEVSCARTASIPVCPVLDLDGASSVIGTALPCRPRAVLNWDRR